LADERSKRRLAAILSADVAGYSRLMEADESGTLAALKRFRAELIDPAIARYGGRIVGTAGDGLLCEFPSVVDAVQCAVDIQQATPAHNANLPEDRRMQLRIGVNLGDVLVEGDDIFGDGVNVAARLEALATPGTVLVSGTVQEQAAGKLPYAFEDLGERSVKNIARPVRVWQVGARVPTGSTPANASAGPASGVAPAERPTIAVLPFANMSGDPEQEYFADGITEDIITELSRFQSFLVMARHSSFHYKGKSPKISDVARELGTAFVIEGSVRKSGNRIRITAQLIDASSGAHLWAERYDRNLEDIFAIQDEIVRAIAVKVSGNLRRFAAERARGKSAASLTAYDHVLRADSIYHSSYEMDEQVTALLQKAVEIDPDCAQAHIRLAMVSAYSVFDGLTDPEQAARSARFHLDKALALGESDAYIHAAASLVYLLIGEHSLAQRHIDRAIVLNPNDPEVIFRAGPVKCYLGDHEEGLRWHELGRRLDPHFRDSLRESIFDAYYLAQRYEDAIALLDGWQTLPAHMYAEIAATYAQLGRDDEAKAAVAQYNRHKKPTADTAAFIRQHLLLSRRQEDRDRWREGFRKAGFEV